MENLKRNFAASVLKRQVVILGAVIAAIWALEAIDSILGGRLDQLGIHPRSRAGLVGILLAPWLHVGFSHVAANSAPFIVLGWLVMLRGFGRFALVTLAAIVIGGLGIWLIGSSHSVHLGLSGVVFGYLGYLLLAGVFERSALSILVATAVGAFYGGLLYGVLPGQAGMSWEGHLFGFLGGAFAAWLLRKRKKALEPAAQSSKPV